MNFTTFPVSGTNIFPLSNSKAGGQLVTEYNLRSRESVATPSYLDYEVGPSFAHSESDFYVTRQLDDQGEPVSTHMLQVAPGRAVINGHYVQTFSPMLVDLDQANKEAEKQQKTQLKGNLAIGIRIYYSTTVTMSGAMIPENDENMYEGIQLVILPEKELKTPFDGEKDAPEKVSEITAHLRLATFRYYNGKITDIQNSTSKLQYLDAKRLADVESLLNNSYVRKSGLNPGHLYAFAGKGTTNDGTKDTWCIADESLMVWDGRSYANMLGSKDEATSTKSAEFQANSITGKTQLIIPHKQIDENYRVPGDNNYFKPVILDLPVADYASGRPGTVDKKYTQNIKNISTRISEYYRFLQGKQRSYLPSISDVSELPKINPSWKMGDYVVVGQDFTMDLSSDNVTAPSTVYVVVPGYVKGTTYQGTYVKRTEKITINSVTSQRTVEAYDYIYVANNSLAATYKESSDEYGNILYVNTGSASGAYPKNIYFIEQTIAFSTYNGVLLDSSVATSSQVVDTVTGTVDSENVVFENESSIRGSADEDSHDYFQVIWNASENEESTDSSGNTVLTSETYTLYYKVAASTKREWSDSILLTGEIPFAQEDVIGGFVNLDPDDAPDAGYVYRDDSGYLRLVDYGLLRQGTYAYQLGEDLELPSGIETDEVQQYLDEYVNQRIAFPNATQKANKTDPNIINIYVDLSSEEDPKEITIKEIDSRFGACLYLHFTGSATSNTTINIVDCQKVRIENNLVAGGPKINVFRSCLYYDAAVFEYIRESHDGDTFGGFQDLTIWHQQMEETDPYLVVDGMKITSVNNPILNEELNFWTPAEQNDNHYSYALRSITFSGEGDIIGCELYVTDDTTFNIDQSEVFIATSFSLPQGYGLTYPEKCLTKPLKVSGAFMTAYYSNNDKKYIVSHTDFAALTQYVTNMSTVADSDTGSITFHTTLTELSLNNDNSTQYIPAADTRQPHIFAGGAIN